MFLWALMASVQTLLVPVPALTLFSGGAEGVSADACSDESALLPLPGQLFLFLTRLSLLRQKTLAVPVKDIAAAIVIHKHFVRYLFFIFKRCSLLFMNIPLLPLYKGMHFYLKDSSH